MEISEDILNSFSFCLFWEFSCHLRTVQLCYYVITDKTISVNSPSIFIRANSRLQKHISGFFSLQTIKILWKEIWDLRRFLAFLIIKCLIGQCKSEVGGWQISDRISNLDLHYYGQTQGWSPLIIHPWRCISLETKLCSDTAPILPHYHNIKLRSSGPELLAAILTKLSRYKARRALEGDSVGHMIFWWLAIPG